LAALSVLWGDNNHSAVINVLVTTDMEGADESDPEWHVIHFCEEARVEV
jgi:hypothetical protein